MLLLYAELEMPFPAHPVQVLERRPRILRKVVLPVVAPDSRTFKVKGLVNVPVWRKQVVHDDKVNLFPVRHLDPVQPVKLREQRVWVINDMLIVVLEDLAQKLVLGVVDRLDDVLVVAGEVEEAAALSGRPQLREYVLAGQGHEIVGGIEAKERPQMAEYPRRIVLELEVVLCRWYQLVSGTATGLTNVLPPFRLGTHISKVDFCLTSKSAAVRFLSILAFVLDTATRMPVSML